MKFLVMLLMALPFISGPDFTFTNNYSKATVARCTGSTPCTACSNCSSCKWCSGGGTCGVCAKTGLRKTNAAPYRRTYSTPGGSSSNSISSQCRAKTKKGTRCSRNARSNGYCWQHGG